MHNFYGVTTNTPLTIFYDVRDKIIPNEFYERALRLWQAAEEAVKDDPARAYNVRMSGVPALHALLSRQPDLIPKQVWVTENPAVHQPSARLRHWATTLLARFEEAQDMRLSESVVRNKEMLSVWRHLAAAPKDMTEPISLQATIEDTQLNLGRPGHWGEIVKDPLAEDGSAMKLFNTHYEWCTTFEVAKIAFDAGKRYRLRMRVRVEQEPEAEGEAFWSGVYDPEKKRGMGGCTRTIQGITEGYHWYTVLEWEPEQRQYFWIGPGRFDKEKMVKNPAIKAICLDKLEIGRMD